MSWLCQMDENGEAIWIFYLEVLAKNKNNIGLLSFRYALAHCITYIPTSVYFNG